MANEDDIRLLMGSPTHLKPFLFRPARRHWNDKDDPCPPWWKRDSQSPGMFKPSMVSPCLGTETPLVGPYDVRMWTYIVGFFF